MRTSIFILSAIAISMALPTAARAAEVSFQSSSDQVGVGDVLEITMRISSAVPVNALSGLISYSSQTLLPLHVSDGNSIFSIWLERPAIQTRRSNIAFSGLIPGGYVGTDGVVVHLRFRAVAEGNAVVAFDGQALRNDGAGTKDDLSVQTLKLSISSVARGDYAVQIDTVPPEPFIPILSTSTDAFNGAPYLVFSAVDKGSGIDHYEIAESRLGLKRFRVMNSPYQLSDAERYSTVYIRAIDTAGNVREVVFPRAHLVRPYEIAVLLGIVICVCAAIFLIVRRRQT